MNFFKKIGKSLKKVAKIGAGVGLGYLGLGGLTGGFGSKVAGFLGTAAPIAGSIYEGKQAQASAKAQMQFQAQQSATAHQREVADLKAAGLNPMLSGTGGSGASTSSGAAVNVPNYASAAADAVSARQQFQLNQAAIKKATAETENTDSNTRLNNYEWQLRKQYGPLEKEGSLWELKSRIKQIAASTASSAQDAKRKALDLKTLLQDPLLRKYVMSSSYGDQAMYDKLLKNPDAGNILKFLMQIRSK
ncbi:MAG: DNA pilot protein [Microvirus sp.]|nr:MAG: DNA pilot protein [Microvirus sp.]